MRHQAPKESKPAADVFAAAAALHVAADVLDPAAILASVGEVPYVWSIADDTLAWGANVADVLKLRDRAAIATGRGYARHSTTRRRRPATTR